LPASLRASISNLPAPHPAERARAARQEDEMRQHISRFGTRPTYASTKRSSRSDARVEAVEPRILLATFTVTGTNDAGPGSLRECILAANANSGADTIAFSIGTGRQTIRPATNCPRSKARRRSTAGPSPAGRARRSSRLTGRAILPPATPSASTPDVSDGNVISGNDQYGVAFVWDGAGIWIHGNLNTLSGNRIGTNPAGTAKSAELQGHQNLGRLQPRRHPRSGRAGGAEPDFRQPLRKHAAGRGGRHFHPGQLHRHRRHGLWKLGRERAPGSQLRRPLDRGHRAGCRQCDVREYIHGPRQRGGPD
jgi:hypothetical protein